MARSAGPQFSIENMYDSYRMLAETDPTWRCVDAAGHQHEYAYRQPLPADFDLMWDDPSKYGPHVPTAHYVVTSPATDEYPECGHYECLQCGAHVEPGTRESPQTRNVLMGVLMVSRSTKRSFDRRYAEASRGK